MDDLSSEELRTDKGMQDVLGEVADCMGRWLGSLRFWGRGRIYCQFASGMELVRPISAVESFTRCRVACDWCSPTHNAVVSLSGTNSLVPPALLYHAPSHGPWNTTGLGSKSWGGKLS